MAIKVNIVLDEDVKNELKAQVVSGMRSRVINKALRRELLELRRRNLVVRQDQLRTKTKVVSTKELVRIIKRDRDRS